MIQLKTDEFIKKAREVHGDKYDYSKVEYVNNHTKVCIICPKHGEFWQVPNSHLNGNGCPVCVGLKRLTKEDFINRANRVHNYKYDYSNCNFISTHFKVDIICPIHGTFSQLPKNHLKGQGCPECGKLYAKEWQKGNYDGFMEESKKRFGDIYEFPNIKEEYVNSHSVIHIKCKKCGNVFTKIACDHLTSPHGGCLKCYSNVSSEEQKLGHEIESIVGKENVLYRDRDALNGREIDIYIPSLKIGIEYDGIYWHSEKYKDKNYHLEKTEECKKHDIKLIHIFEDEYIHHADIVHSKIRHIIGLDNSKKIYGRKCSIKEISNKESKLFLDENHIQGFASSSIYLGAFHEDKLIGVMSFKRESRNENKWELNRFATDIKICCVGVGGKLFKYFIKKYHPTMIKSFADRRWTVNEDNNLYTQIGFKFNGYTRPDYKYIDFKEMKRLHKFGFRKKTLYNKYGLPLSMTEKEMVEKLGYNKIWDCGLIKYTWTDENS